MSLSQQPDQLAQRVAEGAQREGTIKVSGMVTTSEDLVKGIPGAQKQGMYARWRRQGKRGQSTMESKPLSFFFT